MTVQKIRNAGFTLIELLIVMAILGVLAVVVLVAINPVQQLARTRDAGRKSGVAQIGRALTAYYTARGGSYVTENATWLTSLVTAGEISTEPSSISYSAITDPGCGLAAAEQNNWCYDYDATAGSEAAVVFAALESETESSKCDTSGQQPFFVWDTTDGRGGLVCFASGTFPSPGGQTWNTVQ